MIKTRNYSFFGNLIRTICKHNVIFQSLESKKILTVGTYLGFYYFFQNHKILAMAVDHLIENFY